MVLSEGLAEVESVCLLTPMVFGRSQFLMGCWTGSLISLPVVG